KGYGPRPLFTDLSLDLRAGERVGLIGPNGSGKSTLLRLLAGLEEPDAGTRTQRRGGRIGYVPQDDAFPPGQSCRPVVLAPRAVADEVIRISRAYPAGYFRATGPYDDFADKRAAFMDAQARREESVANQVRRETEWLGRKESAQRRKSASRIEDAGRRRDELA